jgi:hypothetical protein
VITATFDDGDSPGSVDLTIDLSGLTDPQDFLSGFYFNFSGPDFSGFNITSPNPEFVDFETGFDAFMAGGGGRYDVVLNFETSNSANRLIAGESAMLTIIYPGLTVDLFDVQAASGGGNGVWRAIAHVQGLGAASDSSGSGWFAGDSGDGGEGEIPEVPEPFTIFLIGGSLLAMTVLRRVRI